jgi:hypothetical protein
MKLRSFMLGITFTSFCTMAAYARATTVDVCVNPATDARFDSTGTFFTGSAPIYAGGTIAQSSSAIDCTKITATPIGTFFTVGGLVAGLPASAAQDVAMVTWHFRLAKGAFDTIGPVQGNGAGGATPGQTYPQTEVGATNGAAPSNGQATVTVLDTTGFALEIKTSRGNGD